MTAMLLRLAQSLAGQFVEKFAKHRVEFLICARSGEFAGDVEHRYYPSGSAEAPAIEAFRPVTEGFEDRMPP